MKIELIALSLHEPWASMIANEEKTIETRMWSTGRRGRILICASKKPAGPLSGCAAALVDLVDVRLMTKADEVAACCAWEHRRFAWVLENIRPTNPIPIRGRQKLFTVEVDWDELFERNST